MSVLAHTDIAYRPTAAPNAAPGPKTTYRLVVMVRTHAADNQTIVAGFITANAATGPRASNATIAINRGECAMTGRTRRPELKPGLPPSLNPDPS